MKSTINFSDRAIPSAIVLGHKTYLLDAWLQIPEKIILPEVKTTGGGFDLEIINGSTNDLDYFRPKRNPLKFLKRQNTTTIEKKVIFDARYEVDTNISHYLLDTLTRILIARDVLSQNGMQSAEIVVILKENSSELARNFFKTLNYQTIETESNIQGLIVKHKIRPAKSTVDNYISYEDFGFFDTTKYAFENILKFRPAYNSQYGEKIFISRKNSRTIENENEIEKILSEHGYKKVYFEEGKLSLEEQWGIVAEAKEIVAIHGAALSSLIFNHTKNFDNGNCNPSRTKLVEIFGPGFFNGYFRSLANTFGINWIGVRGQITPEVVKDMDFMENGNPPGHTHQAASFTVDPFSIHRALELMASEDSI
jgi:capsular polysaccharide biosynthesis protein